MSAFPKQSGQPGDKIEQREDDGRRVIPVMGLRLLALCQPAACRRFPDPASNAA